MSPTVFIFGKYRFYFNSREEKRLHIHVKSPDGEAKFWLEPLIAMAAGYGFQTGELKEIENLIRKHQDDFKILWNKHFSL